MNYNEANNLGSKTSMVERPNYIFFPARNLKPHQPQMPLSQLTTHTVCSDSWDFLGFPPPRLLAPGRGQKERLFSSCENHIGKKGRTFSFGRNRGSIYSLPSFRRWWSSRPFKKNSTPSGFHSGSYIFPFFSGKGLSLPGAEQTDFNMTVQLKQTSRLFSRFSLWN